MWSACTGGGRAGRYRAVRLLHSFGTLGSHDGLHKELGVLACDACLLETEDRRFAFVVRRRHDRSQGLGAVRRECMDRCRAGRRALALGGLVMGAAGAIGTAADLVNGASLVVDLVPWAGFARRVNILVEELKAAAATMPTAQINLAP